MFEEELRELTQMPAEERARFMGWFNRYFKKSNFPNVRKSINDIYELYDFCYPENPWTIGQIHLLLFLLGLTDDIASRMAADEANEELKDLYLEGIDELTPNIGAVAVPMVTNVENVEDNVELLREFIKRETEPRTLALLARRVRESEMKGNMLQKSKEGTDVIDSVLLHLSGLEKFYHTWCVKASMYAPLQKRAPHWRRCPTSALVSAYNVFCVVNQEPILHKKEVLTFFIGKGHKKGKGYACRKAGGIYITDLYVPGCGSEVELQLASQYNMFIFDAGHETYLTKENAALPLEQA